MPEKTTEVSPFDWRVPGGAALVAFFVSLSIAVCQADTAIFLYLFLVAPILILLSIALPIYAIFGKGRRKRLTLLATLGAVWVVLSILFTYYVQDGSTVRTTTRWLVWSRNYKEKVFAVYAPTNGELRHVEWDGWGWGGEDTTVYLVFDPKDSLSSAALIRQPGKFEGIPCPVPQVSRLESQWYAVRFYTNENWDGCNKGSAAR